MNISQPNLSIKSDKQFFVENENVKTSLNPFLNFREHYPFNRFFLLSSRNSSNHLKRSCLEHEPAVQGPNERRSTIGFPFSWIGKGGNSTSKNNIKRTSSNTREPVGNEQLLKTRKNIPNPNEIKQPQHVPFNESIESQVHLNTLQLKKSEKEYNLYIEKCRRVIIFDLDDTLIPTCWIRSLLGSRCFYTYEQALEETKRELNAHNKYDFEIELCSLIQLAKSLSHTVVIVTNARSDKWIDTIKYLFPIFFNIIEKNNISIIRTEQAFEPSHENVIEYFKFWMNAKKKKFEKVLNEHFNIYQHNINKQIDFVSIGDSEFEEVATYELQLDNKNLIKKAYNIKCQSGLTIENFSGQLRLLQVALSIIAKSSYSYNFLALSSYVQIKMFR